MKTISRSLFSKCDAITVIIGFCVVLIAMLWAALIYHVDTEREHEIANTASTNSNLVRVFEEYTLRTIKSVDQVALFLKHEYEKSGTGMDIARYIRDGMIDNAIFADISVLNERGDLVLGSYQFRPINLADHEHFKVHAAQDTGGLYISQPVPGRASGKWSIEFTRRLNKPDGAFAGVIVVSVDPYHFADFYRELDLGDHGMMTLVGRDGAIRVQRVGDTVSIGDDVTESALLTRLKQSNSGNFVDAGAHDKVGHFSSYRVLRDYPLAVAVGTSMDELLTKIESEKNDYYWGASAISLAILLLGALLVGTVWRQKRITAALRHSNLEYRRAEESLRDSEERFRDLTELSSDWYWEQDENLRFAEISGDLGRATGDSPDQFLGKTWEEIQGVHHDSADWDSFQATLAARQPFYDFVYSRTGHAGNIRFFSTSGLPILDVQGNFKGYRGVGKDVTELKLTESRQTMEYAVTRLLAEVATLDEAMPQVIRTICEMLRWDCGSRWTRDASGESMHCVDSWGADAPGVAEFVALNRGRKILPETIGSDPRGGLVRRAWASGEPVWIADITQSTDFTRAALAAQAGLHGAFAFPILQAGKVTGVMEFYVRGVRQPQPELLQMFRAIGSQIGQLMARKQAEETLQLRDRAIEASTNSIMITDYTLPDNPLVYVNPAFERVTGYSAAEVLGRNPRFLHGNDPGQADITTIVEAMREQREGHAVIRDHRKDGSVFWNDLHIAPVRDGAGRVTHFIGIGNDITETRGYQDQLEHQSTHDALTHLPNRTLLGDRLRQAIAHAQRHECRVAVAFIDLDHFKFVNDSLGHNAGDELLKIVSDRLNSCIRDSDTAARQGGDEFVLVFTDQSDVQHTAETLRRILGVVAQPCSLGGHEINVNCSIGCSVFPEDGHDPETLLKNADAAMYRAKEAGRNNIQFYTAEMNASINERVVLQGNLRCALERGEFVLHYQPKADLHSGRFTGVEALVRWQHPELGMVAPDRFIPIAEESGLIVPLGEWVLHTACAQHKAWCDAGLEPGTVAVNLSPRQFQQQDLGAIIDRVIRETGIEPSSLELEITESALMLNADHVVEIMDGLKSSGVRFAIDDFGTGYSSLSYLKRFPLDSLKIDKSFIQQIVSDNDSASITRAVITMAHNLKLKVIAEGVETEAQQAFLAGNHCDEMQGYLFSRPLAAEQITALLQEKRCLNLPTAEVDENTRTLLLVDDEAFQRNELKQENERLNEEVKTANAALLRVNQQLQEIFKEKSAALRHGEISLGIAQSLQHNLIAGARIG